MKTKATYTVEAALICPLLCLLVCAVLTMTLRFYYRVEEFNRYIRQQEPKVKAAQLVRIERIAEELLQEVD